jgi:lysozyme family protein
MRRNFPTVMDHIFKWEGGYVDHPRDPGGATNMGITIHTMEALELDLDGDGDVDKDDVRQVTRPIAESIYRDRYWNAIEGDSLKVGIDLVMMDACVNSGPYASVRWAQRAMGITDDGILGPMTRRALSLAHPQEFITRAINERKKSVRQFRNFDVFGQGWMNRIEDTLESALDML